MTDNNEPLSQLLTCKSKVISPQDRARRVETILAKLHSQYEAHKKQSINIHSLKSQTQRKKKVFHWQIEKIIDEEYLAFSNLNRLYQRSLGRQSNRATDSHNTTPDCPGSNPTSAYYLHEAQLSRSTSPCFNFLLHKMLTTDSTSLDQIK